MTQTRTVNQVKFSQAELTELFRAKAIEALRAEGMSEADAAEFETVNVDWRGTVDRGIAVLLDPVWPTPR